MSHAGITCKTSNAPLFFLTAIFIFLTKLITIRNQFGGENTETQINLAVVSNFTAIEILLIGRLTNYQIIVLLVNSHQEQHTLVSLLPLQASLYWVLYYFEAVISNINIEAAQMRH